MIVAPLKSNVKHQKKLLVIGGGTLLTFLLLVILLLSNHSSPKVQELDETSVAGLYTQLGMGRVADIAYSPESKLTAVSPLSSQPVPPLSPNT